MGKNTVKPLPTYFSTMEHDVSLPKDEVYIPALQDVTIKPVPESRSLDDVYKWLEHVEA